MKISVNDTRQLLWNHSRQLYIATVLQENWAVGDPACEGDSSHYQILTGPMYYTDEMYRIQTRWLSPSNWYCSQHRVSTY